MSLNRGKIGTFFGAIFKNHKIDTWPLLSIGLGSGKRNSVSLKISKKKLIQFFGEIFAAENNFPAQFRAKI
jgi:hypothetical protein